MGLHGGGFSLYTAVETLLKGPEISLTAHDQEPYLDKDGISRGSARLRWWTHEATTLRDYAEMGGKFTTADGSAYPPLPEIAADTVPTGIEAVAIMSESFGRLFPNLQAST